MPGRLRRILFPAAAALIGFGVMVGTIGRISPPWRQIDRLNETGHPLSLQRPAAYVAAHTVPGEHVVIIGPEAEHLIADRAGVVNSSPLNGLTALFGPSEANRALDQLDDEGGTQVFEGASGRSGVRRHAPGARLPRGGQRSRRQAASLAAEQAWLTGAF